MRKYLFVFILLINTCYSFNLRVDYAVFRYSDSLNLMELYYSFPDNALSYKAAEDQFKANIIFTLNIHDGKNIIDSVQWEQEIFSDKSVSKYSTDLIGLKVILVPKGKFSVLFNGYATRENLISGIPLFYREYSLVSSKFDKNSLSISDLQIASVIESQSKSSGKWSKSFLKNSLYVVPNPGSDIIGDSLFLNCYYEIYNAKSKSPEGIDIVYTVLDAGKKEVFHYPKKKKTFSDAMVEFVSLPINALPTGVYYLQVDVIPADENKVQSVLKKFYVSNFSIPPQPVTEYYEDQQFEQSEFATLSEHGVQKHYDQIKQISNDYELGIWDKCTTLGAKQRFLFAFWAKRNTDTTKPYNLALEEFREKISYADKYYKYGLNDEGWRTPRGRVLLKYGHPTLIDRHSAKATQPAYEVWKFDEIQGGLEFVFIDLQNNGYFQLVHSNATGETRNENWLEQYIEKQDPNQNFEYNRNQFR